MTKHVTFIVWMDLDLLLKYPAVVSLVGWKSDQFKVHLWISVGVCLEKLWGALQGSDLPDQPRK